MKIAAHRGNQLQAPENSLLSMISAYTSGAGVLEFDVQLTKDNELVVSHDGTINRLTGIAGDPVFIKDLTLQELRWGTYDFSETFNPYQADGFIYYHTKKRIQIERLQDLLDQLPADIEKLIELKHDSSLTDEMRTTLVQAFAAVLLNRSLQQQVVVYSKDKLSLRLLKELIPGIRTAVFDWELSPDEQLQLLIDEKADGLVTDLDSVLKDETTLTPFGKALQKICTENKLSAGAILYPFRKPGLITQTECNTLRSFNFVWSVSTDSMIGMYANNTATDFSPWLYPQYNWLPVSPFAGKTVDRDWFAFGYAKTNKYCTIHQQDGVHIELKKYDGFLPLPDDPDTIKDRLNKAELRIMYAEKSWPFYSGGGVGIIKPIEGDFIATVDYEMINPMSQAQTLEMAVTNVDPAAHRDKPPVSFRDTDAFYDPHGCPPYVGVEHDENDGYRINWNLGSDYDNNQYGSPVGDGNTPKAGTLRLERRGRYFSAYYKNSVDAPYWICVGVVKNATLNDRIFLRCVAKRWLQEKEDDPSQYYPVQENTFSFKNLQITKPIK
jgi:Glycerophosphoryl diester phosphodiesterase family